MTGFSGGGGGGSLPPGITSAADGNLTFVPTDEFTTAIQIKPVAGASAAATDEIEFYDDAGNLIGWIDAAGNFFLTAVSGDSGTFTYSADGGAVLEVMTGGELRMSSASAPVNVQVHAGDVTLRASNGKSVTLADHNNNALLTAGDNGAIVLLGGSLAFFGATAISQPTITGALSAVTDPAAQAVLTSLLGALVSFGLVQDGTT